MRELERDKVAAAAEVEQERRALRAPAGAVRALSVFDEAVVLVDTGTPDWPLLYCNERWCRLAGARGLMAVVAVPCI